MSLSKKDFKSLAETMRKEVRPILRLNEYYLTCKAIADFCKSQNSLFSREKFYEACGIEDMI